MARTELGTAAPERQPNGARPTHSPRRIEPRRGLPGGRAIVGGLLMAVAAMGVLVAYQRADDSPGGSVVVLVRDVDAGDVIEANDVRLESAEMPTGFTSGFDSIEEITGRVALSPLAAGELVQASSVSERPRSGVHEVALALPRESFAVGRLRRGDRVDVYVTTDDQTASIVRSAEVVHLDASDDRSLTADRVLSVVVAVPSADDVAALVHALRTGEVTLVRSTLADPSSESVVYPGAAPGPDDEAGPG